jgi:hypothetical protein
VTLSPRTFRELDENVHLFAEIGAIRVRLKDPCRSAVPSEIRVIRVRRKIPPISVPGLALAVDAVRGGSLSLIVPDSRAGIV